MKHFIAAITALSMIAATSAAADDVKPISTAQLYAEYLVGMCSGDGDRKVPWHDGNMYPCGRVALNHALDSKKDSTDVRPGGLEYHVWSCEAGLIGRGKLFISLSQAPSGYCRTIDAGEVRPGHYWDYFHGQGCVDMMATNIVDSSHLGRAARALSREPNYNTLE